MPPIGWIVAEAADPLARCVASALRRDGRPFVRMCPERLGASRLSLDGNGLRLDGRRVGFLLWRVGSDVPMSGGFADDERPFIDAEMRAIVLEAMHSPSILAVNRIDPCSWFQGALWPTWRRRLASHRIESSPLTYGASSATEEGRWLLYQSRSARPAPGAEARSWIGCAVTERPAATRRLVVCGKTIDAHGETVEDPVARILDEDGLTLARIEADADGRPIRVDPYPVVHPAEAEATALPLLERFDEHLHRRAS